MKKNKQGYYKIYNPTKGFTLVELLVSMAVISILAGMAAQTFTLLLESRDIAMRRIEISENAHAVLGFMSAELRAAYITPDSVKPITQGFATGNTSEKTPRLRFAGISRNVVVTPDMDVPGAGQDDDGDGWVDEEILDGVDADFPGGAESGLQGARPEDDPIQCEEGDYSCTDEDIGVFPSDLLHFVSVSEDSNSLVLQEVSYGLDPSGTRLIRRAQTLSPSTGITVDSYMDFGQFIDDRTGDHLVPPPVPIGSMVTPGNVVQAINNWEKGARYGSLSSESQNRKYVDRLFEVLAYDVRGLRIRYWYYDYNRGGWRMCPEWDSSRETALMQPGQYLFNQPALNNSIEGYGRSGFHNIIVNEPEDMYPRILGTVDAFFINDPQTLISQYLSDQGEYLEKAEQIAQRTDGLPHMLEITIYIQDRERTVNPRPFTTRVFIPNNYRKYGLF